MGCGFAEDDSPLHKPALVSAEDDCTALVLHTPPAPLPPAPCSKHQVFETQTLAASSTAPGGREQGGQGSSKKQEALLKGKDIDGGTCMYIYIYTCTYIHVHIHMYIVCVYVYVLYM